MVGIQFQNNADKDTGMNLQHSKGSNKRILGGF